MMQPNIIGTEALAPHTQAFLFVSSIWLFLSCILYKNVSSSILLLENSVTHSSKLLNLRALWDASNS